MSFSSRRYDLRLAFSCGDSLSCWMASLWRGRSLQAGNVQGRPRTRNERKQGQRCRFTSSHRAVIRAPPPCFLLAMMTRIWLIPLHVRLRSLHGCFGHFWSPKATLLVTSWPTMALVVSVRVHIPSPTFLSVVVVSSDPRSAV